MLLIKVPGQPSVSIATISATSISPFWSVPQGSVVMNYIVTWERNTSVGCSNVDMGSTTINNSSTGGGQSLPGHSESIKFCWY